MKSPHERGKPDPGEDITKLAVALFIATAAAVAISVAIFAA